MQMRDSAYGDSSSSEEGGMGRGRLTAAEELRGHLEDCLSLYGSRFLYAAISIAKIGTVNLSTSAEVAPLLERAADVGASPTPAQCDDVASSPLEVNGDMAGDFDTSTVATVVWLRDGVRGTTPSAPLGVMVCFQYWGGFTVYAERSYASMAEAEREAQEAAGGETWTPLAMVRQSAAWVLQPAASNTRAALEGSGCDEGLSPCHATLCEQGSAEGSDAQGEEAAGYESLVSLLVHRYL